MGLEGNSNSRLENYAKPQASPEKKGEDWFLYSGKEKVERGFYMNENSLEESKNWGCASFS